MDARLERMTETGIVPVIKVPGVEYALPLAAALSAGGMSAIEVTMRNDAALECIAAIRASNSDMVVAAGTVRSVAQMKEAISAGAQVIVAPGLNEDVATACAQGGIPYIPACVTGTEIELALRLGITMVKFFPAERMGGIPALNFLNGPYPEIRFIPTGGITSENVSAYARLQNVAACGGRFMADEPLILGKRWDEITQNCRAAIASVLGFQLAHVGINHADGTHAMHSALALAELLMLPIREGTHSVFAGEAVECMKAPCGGDKGHIGFYTNSCERALAYCKRRGIHVKETSVRRDGGGLQSFYFDELINGFAVHVVRRKV